MNNTKIIYWYPSGFKIYNIDKKLSPVLEKEVNSNDIVKIETELEYLSGQKVFLLLADSISYLYEKTIDPPLTVDGNFKNKLLEIIKPDIPEDFSQFNWDFKIKDNSGDKQEVIIFAPIKKIQQIISQIFNKLNITIDVVEPESIAITRDSNPIIGIFKKSDLYGKDEEVLNLSLTPIKEKPHKTFKKIFFVLVIIILIITIFFIIKFKNSPSNNTITPISTPSITLIPSITVTVTPVIKEWSDLNILIQNGTNKPGLAAKTATIFKTNKLDQVNISNADNSNYTSNKLIFKDTLLQENYQNKFKEFLIIKDDNISIDNKITYDVIFITVN